MGRKSADFSSENKIARFSDRWWAICSTVFRYFGSFFYR
ncbi:unnamed protein product [Staurois parvus]|uniref:Uncharacterized protein n=1 Tax=Staurois parvus TaxID=386267 RepID=A0ABN9EZX4_9NEOB|nr:unnamed protein product [Staurois parvus]